ncbi:transcription factor TCP19-like [Pyrus ussuriensis x Pyrus communis]|uniref:Transcription factor TCP19-like n=1 Tax=Pyrus ussuriensis x Pyrus communis TaxID=2448454 RepID=A0A5N5I666_9ROSA|nr:transcription factor TCP19-like [Pyrus ussuriensis x Pyrus communis]
MIEDDCIDNSMSTPPSPTRRYPRTISRPGIKIWFDSRASSCSISSGTATGGGGSALLVWDTVWTQHQGLVLQHPSPLHEAAAQNHDEEARQEDDYDEDVREEGGGPVPDDPES